MPEEAINFGTVGDKKFFAIDSYDDADYQNRRYDLGFGSVSLDMLGNISTASFHKGKFSSNKVNHFSVLSSDVDVKWTYGKPGLKVPQFSVISYQYTIKVEELSSPLKLAKTFNESFLSVYFKDSCASGQTLNDSVAEGSMKKTHLCHSYHFAKWTETK